MGRLRCFRNRAVKAGPRWTLRVERIPNQDTAINGNGREPDLPVRRVVGGRRNP